MAPHMQSMQVSIIGNATSMLNHCGWMNDQVGVKQAVMRLEQPAARGVAGQRRAWHSCAVIAC